jgi:hypothetical protein
MNSIKILDNVLPRDWVTGNWIYWTIKKLVTTLHRSLPHRLVFSVTVFTALLGKHLSTLDIPLHLRSSLRWLVTISDQPPTLLTTLSRLSRNGSRSSLYNLGTDRIENIAFHRSSIVACASLAAITWRLMNHYLPMSVVAEPFSSNGRFSASTVLALSKYGTVCCI